MKIELNRDMYQYFRIDYSINPDGVMCLKFRENLRTPVPDDITGITVENVIDIDLTNPKITHVEENNEYFCDVHVLTKDVVVNKLIPNNIEYCREEEFVNVPEPIASILLGFKDNYSYDPNVRVARVNGVNIPLTVIMDSGEKYIEINVDGAPTYDCNNLPKGWQENDTVYFDSIYDFELLNIPEEWNVESMRKNINFNINDSNDEIPDRKDGIILNFGLRTSPNRTLKMMYKNF